MFGRRLEVRTFGTAEIRERMLKAGDEVRNAGRRTLLEIGTEIRDAAAAAAPKKTGKLARSIHMKLAERLAELKLTVGPPTFYGKFLENGVLAGKAPTTASGGLRGLFALRESKHAQHVRMAALRGSGQWRISPRPFMAPAIERVRGKVDSMLEAAMSKAIQGEG